MRYVAYDDKGLYDVNSNYYLTPCWDESGQFAYDCNSGEELRFVDPETRHDHTQEWINAIIAVFGNPAVVNGQRQMPPQLRNTQAGASITAGADRSGLSGGINLSTNTLMLIAGGFLLFMLGSQKGGRR